MLIMETGMVNVGNTPNIRLKKIIKKVKKNSLVIHGFGRNRY